MEQTGIVVGTQEQYAFVTVSRQSACENCHKTKDGQSCRECRLFDTDNSVTVRVGNPLGAVRGDKVKIESPSGKILLYAFVTFCLPVMLGFLVSYGVSAATDTAWLPSVVFVLTVLVCFVFLRLFLEPRVKSTFLPQIKSIL